MININLKFLWVIAAIFVALSSARAETFEDLDPFCEKADEPNPPNPNCVSASTFVDKVLKADDVVIVMATASWCGPCRRFKKELPEVLAKFEGRPLRFYGIQYDKNERFLQEVFGTRLLPSLHVFHRGERRWKFSATPGGAGASIRDFGYALKASEKGIYTITQYPTLLESTSQEPVADKILKFQPNNP